MDENLTEGNGPAEAVKDEDMEVTVTSQLEDVLVTSDNAEMVSNTQTLLEEERADAQRHSIAATVSLDTDSSSSSSSSFSSPSAPAAVEEVDEGFSQPAPIKTRDEILLEELPAVEEVCITLPEEAELQPLGTVSNIIQQLVIIQSLKDTPPLNDGSIIFKSDREAAAKVFEVFGPVSSPMYVLRFNSVDQIISKGLKEGTTLYYAPAIKEYTGYILTQQLQGSDASWKNDQEPPEEVCIQQRPLFIESYSHRCFGFAEWILVLLAAQLFVDFFLNLFYHFILGFGCYTPSLHTTVLLRSVIPL
uniref:H/ACA ribonucleoprotein complex subunit n=1 Tax=Pundamilia nyererei TaxID=303518 RepID=A0A3B4H4N2_9CICH